MARRATLLAAAAAALALASPGTAAATRQHFCSVTGDYCTAVERSARGPRLELSTFSFGGTYELCIAAPDTSTTCRDFLLHKARHGIERSRVLWRRSFPDLGPGRYTARFSKDTVQLGPALFFNPYTVCGGAQQGSRPHC